MIESYALDHRDLGLFPQPSAPQSYKFCLALRSVPSVGYSFKSSSAIQTLG